MLKLWGRVNSINVQKVLWALAELGLDIEKPNPLDNFSVFCFKEMTELLVKPTNDKHRNTIFGKRFDSRSAER